MKPGCTKCIHFNVCKQWDDVEAQSMSDYRQDCFVPATSANLFNLQVHEYCEQCSNFDAVSRNAVLYVDTERVMVTHAIYCSREEQCAELFRYLEKTRGKKDE